jgi:hypothetical protein
MATVTRGPIDPHGRPAFSVRVGDNIITIKPDPKETEKSLCIINGELHRADFRIDSGL